MMKKIKEFIEKNAKIIEVLFSLISLIIVGIFGTTISINNSITSRASLELSKANSQPIFNIKIASEAVGEELSESISIEIDSGFAENLSVNEYVFLTYNYEENGENVEKKVSIDNYYLGTFYSGNNRGVVCTLKGFSNAQTLVNLQSEIVTHNLDKYKDLHKSVLIEVSYKDITGDSYLKYYENSGFTFNHLENEAGGNLVKEINEMPKIKLAELSIEKLETL